MRLIDADALREIWVCLPGHDFEPSSFVYSIDNAQTVEPASPWHRVEDELPNEKGPYITAYYDGYVGENVWHFIGETAVGWMYDADAVRYWMTVPEPPQEET